MSTVGTLFVVCLGMSSKEEHTLERLFKPQVLKLSICLRADLRKYGVTIGCSACSDIAVRVETAELTQKTVEQGLASKWSTNVCQFTKADKIEMPVKVSGESASEKKVERMLLLTMKNVLLRAEGRNTRYKMNRNNKPRPRPGWGSGGVRSVIARNSSQIWRVTSTVLVVSGSAPI